MNTLNQNRNNGDRFPVRLREDADHRSGSAGDPGVEESGAILSVNGLRRDFPSGGRTLTVLRDATFSVAAGEALAFVGPSGSGKTTLLSLCAGLDQPSAGTVRLAGHALERLGEDARAAVRSRWVGFVFQNFQLMPSLTALENVMVPMELRGERGSRKRAHELLAEVGLAEREGHYPVQLSGGEQQRVSLARAFINEPSILFADEPTGNLDANTSHHVEELLFALNERAGTTLVLVTHNTELARRCGRVLEISGGLVRETGRQ